jgi:hypothetical protein
MPISNLLSRAFRKAGTVFAFVWRWSVPYNSRNRPVDPIYASVWTTQVDKDSTLDTLQEIFPNIPRKELPTGEEEIRFLVRALLLPPCTGDVDSSSSQASSQTNVNIEQAESKNGKLLYGTSEEAWDHVPSQLQYLLASMNSHHLQEKLDLVITDNFHTPAGKASIARSASGIRKTFSMWRHGFKQTVSRTERYLTNLFFIFLVLSACYPDVAAGFLGERSYNQRSIGGRIVTLCQLFFLWTYPFHSAWLLFNWSLERLLGAFVGSSVYALAAVVPAIHAAYKTNWFRIMMLVLSMSWQIGVQFSPALRDYVVRIVTRRQMTTLRRRADAEKINWDAVDKSIDSDLQTLRSFLQQHHAGTHKAQQPPPPHKVPIRVRTERYIQFTSRFKLGRPADQLVGLVKDDFECIINTYSDYKSTMAKANQAPDDGHVEPRTPKLILVFFDILIFAYVCYSFYPQPFTFNTVVAYGTVVVIKQTLIALKRYQTPKSARRLFTNMVSINILGMLLVSTPVTVDRDVLSDDGTFVALTLAMVFATLFLAEPIAPLLLSLVEKMVQAWNWLSGRMRKEKSDSEGGRGGGGGCEVRDGEKSGGFVSERRK